MTIADLFKAAGYATGMVGKWHNGLFDMRHHPNNRGFGEFVGFLVPHFETEIDMSPVEREVNLADAMPTLQRLQAQHMPLVLAKDVYQGFSPAEYDEILDSLSPRGLSVHLAADSVAEGQDVMAAVRARARE